MEANRNIIMSLFGTGATGTTVEKEQDFNKRTLDTNIYKGKIKMAFADKSSGGAAAVVLQLALESGKIYDETVYVSNKLGKNTYEKEVSGEKKEFYLPGFLLMNNLAIMACNKSLHDLAAEVGVRTVKVRDWEAKADVLKDVQAIIPMLDKDVLVAIQEEEYEKTTYDEASKKRVGTGEYGIKNVLVKVYNPETRQTAVEMRDDKEAAQADAWLKTYGGKLKEADRSKGGSPNQKTLAAAPTTPSGLF